MHLNRDATAGGGGKRSGAVEVAGDAGEHGVCYRLAEEEAHSIGPDAKQRTAEDLSEGHVAGEVIQLFFAGGVGKVSEAAGVGGEAGGGEAVIERAGGERLNLGEGGVRREVLREAEPFDAVVAAASGDVDHFFG